MTGADRELVMAWVQGAEARVAMPPTGWGIVIKVRHPSPGTGRSNKVALRFFVRRHKPADQAADRLL